MLFETIEVDVRLEDRHCFLVHMDPPQYAYQYIRTLSLVHVLVRVKSEDQRKQRERHFRGLDHLLQERLPRLQKLRIRVIGDSTEVNLFIGDLWRYAPETLRCFVRFAGRYRVAVETYFQCGHHAVVYPPNSFADKGSQGYTKDVQLSSRAGERRGDRIRVRRRLRFGVFGKGTMDTVRQHKVALQGCRAMSTGRYSLFVSRVHKRTNQLHQIC